jgi:hypothetical protein
MQTGGRQAGQTNRQMDTNAYANFHASQFLTKHTNDLPLQIYIAAEKQCHYTHGELWIETSYAA